MNEREMVELTNDFGVVALASRVTPSGLVAPSWNPTRVDVAKTWERFRPEIDFTDDEAHRRQA